MVLKNPNASAIDPILTASDYLLLAGGIAVRIGIVSALEFLNLEHCLHFELALILIIA